MFFVSLHLTLMFIIFTIVQISRLQQIHHHGYVHGDIKLYNILMDLSNECLTAFVIDFGIAKKYCHSDTGKHIPFRQAQHLRGTPAFSSIHSHVISVFREFERVQS